MSSIDSVSTLLPSGPSSSSSTSTSQANAAADVDYNSFLKILVAEVNNPDPLNPKDATEFIGQLASFSALGQQIQTNSKLDSLLLLNSLQQADSALGHTLTSQDGAITGKVVSVTLDSSGSPQALLDNGQTLPLTSGITVSS